MRFILGCCLVLLAVSPVFLESTEDVSHGIVDGSSEDSVAPKAQIEGDNDSEESEESMPMPYNENSDKNIQLSHSERPRPVEKDTKNTRRSNKRIRNRGNRLDRKKKRPSRRRTSNGKKGLTKKAKNNTDSLTYHPPSSHINKVNSVIDQMLFLFTATMDNDRSLDLKITNVPANLKVLPWAYVGQRPLVKAGAVVDARRKRDTPDEADELESSEVEDVDHNEDDQPLITQEQTPASDNTTSIRVVEDADDDEDDDEDKVASARQEAAAESAQHRLEPWPVTLPDGSVEYNLQLLSEKDALYQNVSARLGEDDDEDRPSGKQTHQQRRKNRNRRRIKAQVEGLYQINRAGDAKISLKESRTGKKMDIQIETGPLQLILEDSNATPSRQRWQVTSPQLAARLRLVEKDAKLVATRFKPTKIHPNDVVVTVRLIGNNTMPDNKHLGSMVTHLSNEMSRAWNSGYLLRRVKRVFNKLYIEANGAEMNEEARKLVANLLVPYQSNDQLNGTVAHNDTLKVV